MASSESLPAGKTPGGASPSPEVLELLRCPETGQALSLAPAELIGRLQRPMEAGLVREDGQIVYPICQGIPLLIVEEAVPVPAP